jgi:hypothetical protein
MPLPLDRTFKILNLGSFTHLEAMQSDCCQRSWRVFTKKGMPGRTLYVFGSDDDRMSQSRHSRTERIGRKKATFHPHTSIASFK